MSNTEPCQLGDLIEFQRGYDLPKSQFVDGPYPVQSSNGILGFHSEYKVKAPGITIGRSGTVGLPHFLEKDFFPHNTALFVKDFKGNNVKYIYYLLKYLRLGSKKSGSGVPTMNRNHLHPLKIQAIRNPFQQKKVAEVLSALDEKIELNNQASAELEAIVKTLYDYWFVQFDFPDDNGKPYKSSGGEMVYNQILKREIPGGWEVKKICEISQVKAGGDKPKEFSEEKTTTHSIPIFSNGVNDDGLYGYTTKSKVDKPSVTVSARGTIGFTVLRMKPFVPIIRLIVLTPYSELDLKFLDESVRLFDFENSGSVQQQLTVPQISSLQIAYPPPEYREKYSSLVEDCVTKIELLKAENQELMTVRDWLLPMLMNGQVTVR